MSTETSWRLPASASALLAALAPLGAPLAPLSCKSGDDDGDDDHVIPPPDGCSFNALAGVSFDFTIHYFGVDYPQDALVDLMEDVDLLYFEFPFLGKVTRLELDAESDRMVVRVTEEAPEGEPPAEDPNYVEVLYQLPMGYELPVALDQIVIADVVVDIGTGDVVHAFAFAEASDPPALLFLAEPTDIGKAFPLGDEHPVFQDVDLRDRACPALGQVTCAKNYNLSVEFELHETEGGVPGESFELWPTEHRDFLLGPAQIEMRVVNVWSYAWREIDPDCAGTGYDYDAERFSYFVTRAAFSPPDDGEVDPN